MHTISVGRGAGPPFIEIFLLMWLLDALIFAFPPLFGENSAILFIKNNIPYYVSSAVCECHCNCVGCFWIAMEDKEDLQDDTYDNSGVLEEEERRGRGRERERERNNHV